MHTDESGGRLVPDRFDRDRTNHDYRRSDRVVRGRRCRGEARVAVVRGVVVAVAVLIAWTSRSVVRPREVVDTVVAGPAVAAALREVLARREVWVDLVWVGIYGQGAKRSLALDPQRRSFVVETFTPSMRSRRSSARGGPRRRATAS